MQLLGIYNTASAYVERPTRDMGIQEGPPNQSISCAITSRYGMPNQSIKVQVSRPVPHTTLIAHQLPT